MKQLRCSPEKKTWMSSILSLGDAKLDVGDILDKVEERGVWSRFGL